MDTILIMSMVISMTFAVWTIVTGCLMCVKKTFLWKGSSIDVILPISLILYSSAILLSSPNKIHALTSLPFGLMHITVFFILALYLSHRRMINIFSLLRIIGALTSLTALAVLFLTGTLNQAFEHAIFLGYIMLASIPTLVRKRTVTSIKKRLIEYVLCTIILLTLTINIYQIIRKDRSMIFSHVRLSLTTTSHTTSHFSTFFIGQGSGEFASVAAQFSPIPHTFDTLTVPAHATSSLLHIFIETGIIGTMAVTLLLLVLTIKIVHTPSPYKAELFIAITYVFLVFLLMPPSYILLLLISILLSYMMVQDRCITPSYRFFIKNRIVLIFIGILIFGIGIGFSYSIYRIYSAEYFLYQSRHAVKKNEVSDAYRYAKKSVVLNPYLEAARLHLATLGIQIAEGIAGSKTTSSDDRMLILANIQIAINEAKSLTHLRPHNGKYWYYLGELYRQLTSVVKDADVWSTDSYETSLKFDPHNPYTYFYLGALAYARGEWNRAIELFRTSSMLYPSWPNAKYNLAWAFYQKHEYTNAVSALEGVLELIKKDSQEFIQAQQDLAFFKEATSKNQGD